MDVTTAIKGRRSIRKYVKKDLPEKTLSEVLEAARAAPSAANRQSWELVAVKDPELKAELVAACKNQKFVEDCSVFLAGIEDPQQKWGKVDLTIAIDHITLEAHARGLGTCWIGAFDPAKVGEILGVPANRQVAVCLTLGYPDEAPEARTRKHLNELVHYDRYGTRQ
jgi:nitroreductase